MPAANAVKKLTFSALDADLPWLPDNAKDYDQWTSHDTMGTFTVHDDRFAFLAVTVRSQLHHYWIGLLPAAEEPSEPFADTSEMRKWLHDRLSSNDRRNVTASLGEVNAGFFYGVRYCKPCLVCGAELETANTTEDAVLDQPVNGTNFTSHGHYGSGAFDPMGREHLSINICDSCLTGKAKQGRVTHVAERQRVIDESVRSDWRAVEPS